MVKYIKHKLESEWLSILKHQVLSRKFSLPMSHTTREIDSWVSIFGVWVACEGHAWPCFCYTFDSFFGEKGVKCITKTFLWQKHLLDGKKFLASSLFYFMIRWKSDWVITACCFSLRSRAFQPTKQGENKDLYRISSFDQISSDSNLCFSGGVHIWKWDCCHESKFFRLYGALVLSSQLNTSSRSTSKLFDCQRLPSWKSLMVGSLQWLETWQSPQKKV